MKQLYVVCIEHEIIVVAENEVEAIRHAGDSLRDLDIGTDDMTASPMSYLANGWGTGEIPYGYRDPKDPDRTVGEWVQQGAAPKYNKLQAKLLGQMIKPK